MVECKGAHFPREVILYAVFFYVRYAVSYRDLEEIMAERGIAVDHATLNRTQRNYQKNQSSLNHPGSWVYLYRAVDKYDKMLDFMLSQRRNKPVAIKFFARVLEVDGLPPKIAIDKSGANTTGIKTINKMLKGFGCPMPIEMVRRKYLNNIVEQDHRFIKKRTRPMPGFKSFASASATLAGIEVAHMIRKEQLTPGLCPCRRFAELAE